MSAPCLREKLGRFGDMAFVRETPLFFIPISNHGTITPNRGSREPALSDAIGSAGDISEARP